MIEYCPQNISLSDVWIDHGFSECFFETVSNSIVFLFLLFFGSIELYIYKSYATAVNEAQIQHSQLYRIQLFLHMIIPILALVRFILQATLFEHKEIYGYMILSCIIPVFTYPFAMYILVKERKYMLPSVPTKGHGLILLLFWSFIFISENLEFVNLGKKAWWFNLKTLTDQLEMTLFILRYSTCLFIFILGLKAPGIALNMDYYGINDSTLNLNAAEPVENQGSTFRNVWKKIKTLSPFLWPKKDIILQFRVLICLFLLLSGRVINLFVPIYSKKIVDSMAIISPKFRWDYVLIYVVFKFLQGGGTGGMGLINNLRSFLWIRVQQYTTREIQVELFSHLHGLSLRWHLGRKTGEVLRAVDRGTDSIDNLLSYILFSIIPTLVDIGVAVVFFISAFNIWFGIIVFSTMILYIVSTIVVTEWRTKFIRKMNLAENATKGKSVDSLLNFETVKYYGAEQYEVNSYRDTILIYQSEEWKAMVTLNFLNTVQNIIVCFGLLAGSLLCVHMVVNGQTLTVGDYVLFASYIIQLYVPLNWFGTYYRAIQKNFIDMENMLDLLKEDKEVIDAPNAETLIVKQGQVDFKNVTFGYTPERVILKNISFSVPPGKTLAIVGPTGSGKSTIMRLIFRFYDVNQGAVFIDGINIKTVTQASLRRAIGVVPQDTVLFNNTLMYNIHYGNMNAREADVIIAAKNADIHEKILTFPDKYETQVGERGLRLSGGEKQRIAIARTLLKSPSIILLDEATSALDTNTERNIQTAINQVCANRTTIIIAHRLSTIIHADEIIVVKDGEIVERGKHEELLENSEGIYAEMWKLQLESLNENSQNNKSDEDQSLLKKDV